MTTTTCTTRNLAPCPACAHDVHVGDIASPCPCTCHRALPAPLDTVAPGGGCPSCGADAQDVETFSGFWRNTGDAWHECTLCDWVSTPW
jgi:hypothetical protein